LLGAQFTGHGHMADFTVKTTEGAGAVTPRLRPEMVVFDEFYVLRRRTKARRTVVQTGWWEHQEYPLTYARRYGKGRVFYTALGHDERVFTHPDFQQLVTKGLLWATGQGDGKPVRLACVGYGPHFGMGRYHANAWRETPGLEFVGVCDQNPERLQAATDEMGECATFTDVEDLIAAGIADAAAVLTPHNAHEPLAVRLLEAGLHVVVEKPMAITVEECDRMIAAAEQSGRMLSVFHNRHWDPDIVTLKRIVEAGLIGEVFSIECNMLGYGRPAQWWRSNKAISGGIVYDMGAHQFEKILQLVSPHGSAGPHVPVTALAFGHAHKRVWWDVTNEDYVRGYLRFPNGLEAQLVQSDLAAARKDFWTIQGTRGGIVVPDWSQPAIVTAPFHNTTVKAEYPQAGSDQGPSYYTNLADHLHLGLPLIIPPRWARNPIAAIRACETSAREDRAVEVTFDL